MRRTVWSLLQFPALLCTFLTLSLLTSVFAQTPLVRREAAVDQPTATAPRLSPELQGLSDRFAVSRGPKGPRQPYELSDRALLRLYGIRKGDPNPVLEVMIQLRPGQGVEPLEAAGARVRFRVGDLVYASVPVRSLRAVGRLDQVQFIRSVPVGRLPRTPEREQPMLTRARGNAKGAESEPLANEFDHQGLTGKGVAVVVVDTGIDWRHPDFVGADGKTRILALWDIYDDSFDKSGGKIGSAPPHQDAKTGKPIGTLYTEEQLNDALAGKGEVHSRDRVGHGTACAGTAAGGPSAGTWAGVAPEASLVVVNASLPPDPKDPDSDRGISNLWLAGTQWAVGYCAKRGVPCVVNQSFGNNHTAKDGTDPSETVLDGLAGAGKPGVAICAAAGNEGRYSFHASGRFGPEREGQVDSTSAPIELVLDAVTEVYAYFRHEDDWGLRVLGRDHFLVDTEGRPMEARFFAVRPADSSEAPGVGAELYTIPGAKPAEPADLKEYQAQVEVDSVNPTTDRLVLPLPPGRYLLRGYGHSERVTSGDFDLFLPDPGAGNFGLGTRREVLVNSPGTARNVITVGAYNFRGTWTGSDNKETRYSLRPGELAEYSSPGFRRDGPVKPDLSAPASFTISSLAENCAMGKEGGRRHVTPDGKHIAWEGTSSATPYVAGVVALMLQKNPTLDSTQILEILIKTAREDAFTGKVPNPKWGHGKINPEAALRATPAAPGKEKQS